VKDGRLSYASLPDQQEMRLTMKHDENVLVLGASGLVGSRVVDLLAREGREVTGASREPRGPGQRKLDLLDAGTFAPALRGITTVMLMSRPGDEDAHLHAEPLVQAMVAAGVRRVVTLSALGAEQRPEFSLRKVELLVERSGLAWTHVRPNFFMQMLALPPLSTEIASRRTLSLPLAGAAIAYVDANDVAAVLHRALVDPSLAGQGLAVSGPQALTHAEIAASISEAIGAEVRYVELDEDAARQLMLARGFAPRHVERVLTFYRLIRAGFCCEPDQSIAGLLGRPLRSWEEFVRGSANAWRSEAQAA
jgi:uncharacterized protein YbjT (DUF2867 family)